jgi:hypothetical protein
MPRFFFDLRAADGLIVPDHLGIELPNVAAAIREAAETAWGFSRDGKLGGYDYTGWYFKIRSRNGSITVPAFVTELEPA